MSGVVEAGRPTVALVGTTASGKSELALRAASARPGVEIVSVDSMCVYRGMDLGTAKPPVAVRERVPHHLVDVADPGEEFTVARFQRLARQALRGIAERGGQALLVGGTGLHLRAVVDGLRIPGRFPEVAAQLEAEADGGPDALERLHTRLQALDPVAAGRIEPTNRRRLVRALEVTVGSGRPFSSYGPGLEAYPPTPVVMVGLPYEREAVDRRIEERFAGWMEHGLLEEVRTVASRPGGLSRTARQALGYRELLAHVEEGVPLEDRVRAAVQRTKAYARRQRAWLERDPRIQWVPRGEDPLRHLVAALDGEVVPSAKAATSSAQAATSSTPAAASSAASPAVGD